ncbi:MerR family transcriptional regulator [Streptomyces sp. NPDC088812]|uniref:MerR family transcriptional regulator n=1 Tax=Streptomyces sp. NPDC088812 TaxID=3365905 RepID=UPI0038133249
MRIGALVEATGVSRRLLRYYEEQGLLRPARQPNGYREYAEADVVTVGRIRALLGAGLPTAVIARILACVHDDGARLVPSGCPGVINHLRREHARIDDAITQLRTSQEALDALLDAALRHSHDAITEGESQVS